MNSDFFQGVFGNFLFGSLCAVVVIVALVVIWEWLAP